MKTISQRAYQIIREMRELADRERGRVEDRRTPEDIRANAEGALASMSYVGKPVSVSSQTLKRFAEPRS